jgi:hypothetical protein
MNLEINLFTWKGFEQCIREETTHLAALKSKSIKFDNLLDQANRRQKNGLVWINWKKISQIIKEYFYLPFFLLTTVFYGLQMR